MFFNFKKSYKTSGYLNGFTDWHSHILPGVDDGIRTMDESLAVLAYYESLGMSEVWLTPHIMEDIPNTTEDLKKRFEDLCKHYEGNMKLHLAAEYMLDNLFVQRLSEGEWQVSACGNIIHPGSIRLQVHIARHTEVWAFTSSRPS